MTKRFKGRKVIVDFWYEHYLYKGHCSLCGNHGVIDTTGIKTPAGFECGRVNWCICPNGLTLRQGNSNSEIKDVLT